MISQEFPITAISKDVPKEQRTGENCVYIVRNFKRKIIYIGKSKDVYQRMSDHKKFAKWYETNLVLEIYEFDTYADAGIVETLLINYFQPEANISGYWKDDLGRSL
jgi:excinuclease UvrABC nuclease subunit